MYMAKSFYYMKGQCLYYYNCCNVNSVTHTFHEDKWEDYKNYMEKHTITLKIVKNIILKSSYIYFYFFLFIMQWEIF